MNSKAWTKMWLLATAFNFVIALPILLAPKWTYELVYVTPPGDPLAVVFWRDFGFAVALLGIGYFLVFRDINKNRGIVYLGIVAKLFDVIVLTYRFVVGISHAVVLIPAAIDGGFVILFVLFLIKHWPAEKSSQDASS